MLLTVSCSIYDSNNLLLLLHQFSVEKCDFIVDLDNDRRTKLEPVYSENTYKWEVIHTMPFLDSER